MVHTDESLIRIDLTRHELMCLEPVSSSRFGMDEQRGKSKVEFVCVYIWFLFHLRAVGGEWFSLAYRYLTWEVEEHIFQGSVL